MPNQILTLHGPLSSNGSRATFACPISERYANSRLASRTSCTASLRFSRTSSRVGALRIRSRKLLDKRDVPLGDRNVDSGQLHQVTSQPKYGKLLSFYRTRCTRDRQTIARIAHECRTSGSVTPPHTSPFKCCVSSIVVRVKRCKFWKVRLKLAEFVSLS